MQPIPKIALVHDITLYTITGVDADNNPVISASAPVSFVRCEPVKDWMQNTLGEMKDDRLLMFYDCVNSKPASLAFNKGDKIKFNGQDYFVRTVKDFTPHHLEISLK